MRAPSDHTASQEKGIKPSPLTAGTNQFSRREDYDKILDRLFAQFMKQWNNSDPSPSTGLSDYKELTVLGVGSFGQVKLVKNVFTHKFLAAKVLFKDHIVKTKQVRHVYNEKKVLQSVSYPFLISLEFSSKDNDCLYLGIPFIAGGELFTYHRKMHKLSEKHARFYVAQVVLALEYMHHCQLLYRDLKPENIMICVSGYIKIVDFGFTKKVLSRTQTLCGTPEYLAPEIIMSKPYGVSVDWWAVGILCYELVEGKSPFSAYRHDVMTMYRKICEGHFKMPSAFSEYLSSLVKELLEIDVTKRLGSLINGNKAIKAHDWFKSLDWYAVLNQEIIPPYIPIIESEADTGHFDNWQESQYVKSSTNRHADLFADF